jgi:hypothetical protein
MTCRPTAFDLLMNRFDNGRNRELSVTFGFFFLVAWVIAAVVAA